MAKRMVVIISPFNHLRFWQGTTRAWLFCALFLVHFEMAAAGSFHLLEGSLLLLGVSAAALWAVWGRAGRRRACRRALGRLRRGRGAVAALSAYLACELGGFLLAGGQPGHLAAKYKVVLLMLGLCTLLLGCPRTLGPEALLCKALGTASLSICLLSVVNYCFVPLFPVPYLLRISLRSDYNMFATALLSGLLCGCAVLLQSGRPLAKFPGLFLLAGVQLPVIILSGSRRIMLVLPPTLLALFWLLWREWRPPGLTAVRRGALLGAGALLTVCLVWLSVAALQQQMEESYRQYGSQGRPGLFTPGGETGALQRYQAATRGGLLDKRRILWGIAWEEALSSTPRQWLLGRGMGSAIALYDRPNPALEQAYPDPEKRLGLLSPHNFLLTDLLDGGLPRLAAGLWLTGAVFCLWLRLWQRDRVRGACCGGLLGLVLLGSLISNRYGLFYDKYFWLGLCWLLLGLEAAGPVKEVRR